MIATILMGGLGGGLVLFGWGILSSMIMPWSRSTTLRFMGEDAMTDALARHAPESGVYVLPHAFPLSPGMTPEERNATMQGAFRQMQTGTFLFAAVRFEGIGSFNRGSILALSANVLSAAMVTGLLWLLPELCFAARLAIVELVAAVAVLVGTVPNWIWWGFSGRYVMSGIINTFIGWALAGCLLATLTS